MSGFAAEWLALREHADHLARNAALRDAVSAMLATNQHAMIVDLACGSGSNLRGLAPFLPARQTWRLVDSDPLLLAAARGALVAWADDIDCHDPLVLSKEGRRLEIHFVQVDLSTNLDAALEGPIDLVTSAAFFDLVSRPWIELLCEALSRRALPLYSILTYSGEETWLPPHPADGAMLAAFHRHQQTDKGFGAAAGLWAASILRPSLETRGYRVAVQPSPWRLGEADAKLIEALADGAAQAAAETGAIDMATIDDWRLARRQAKCCEIGHLDLFAALPPSTGHI